MPEVGIGGVIKAYREQRGYSQGGVVRRVNATGLAKLSQSYVSMLEKGLIVNVGPDKLQAFALVFGVSVDTLLHDAGVDPAAISVVPADDLADIPLDLARDIARLSPKLRARVAGYVRALVEETAAQEAQSRRKKPPHRAAEDADGEEPPAGRISATGRRRVRGLQV